MATKNIVPNADSEGGIGTSSKYWATGYIDAITTTGNLAVGGNIQIPNDGTIGSAGTNGALTISSGGAATFSGNVGIGTTTLDANANLTVFGNYRTDFIRDYYGGNRAYILRFGANTASSGHVIGSQIVASLASDDVNGSLEFYTKNAGNLENQLTITSGGDVLINATSRANGYDTNFKTLSIASTVSDKASIIELIGTRGAGGNQNGMIHFLNNSAAITETSRISGLTASGTNGHLGGAIGFDTKEHNGSLRRVAQFTDSGNLLFALSGKGIVFNQSASSGTSTSETLDAYEEGSWTPTLLNANGNESTEGMYTRIGNTVRVGGLIIFGSQSNTTQFTIQSFPFQVGTTNEGTRGGVSVGYSTSSTYYTILMDNGYTQARVWGQGATGNPTLASLSGTRVYFGGTYQV